jgi:hypothetical protein
VPTTHVDMDANFQVNRYRRPPPGGMHYREARAEAIHGAITWTFYAEFLPLSKS